MSDRFATVVDGDINTLLGSRASTVRLRQAFPDGPAPLDVTTFNGPLWFQATLDQIIVAGR